jgi:hypothetical protein
VPGLWFRLFKTAVTKNRLSFLVSTVLSNRFSSSDSVDRDELRGGAGGEDHTSILIRGSLCVPIHMPASLSLTSPLTSQDLHAGDETEIEIS